MHSPFPPRDLSQVRVIKYTFLFWQILRKVRSVLINRQALGNYPPFDQSVTARDRLITERAPHLITTTSRTLGSYSSFDHSSTALDRLTEKQKGMQRIHAYLFLFGNSLGVKPEPFWTTSRPLAIIRRLTAHQPLGIG